MKPINYLFAFVLALQSLYAAAQSFSELSRYPLKYHAIKLGIGENWLMLPMNGVSYERRINKLSAQLEFAFAIPRPYSVDTILNGKSNGYSVRLEMRNYSVKERETSFYLGANIFYMHYKTAMTDWFTDTSRTMPEYEDSFVLTKSFWGTAAKVGMQTRFLGCLLIDASVGLGFKTGNVIQQGRAYPQDIYAGKHLTPRTFETRHGNVTMPIFPVNLSIGYFF